MCGLRPRSVTDVPTKFETHRVYQASSAVRWDAEHNDILGDGVDTKDATKDGPQPRIPKPCPVFRDPHASGWVSRFRAAPEPFAHGVTCFANVVKSLNGPELNLYEVHRGETSRVLF